MGLQFNFIITTSQGLIPFFAKAIHVRQTELHGFKPSGSSESIVLRQERRFLLERPLAPMGKPSKIGAHPGMPILSRLWVT